MGSPERTAARRADSIAHTALADAEEAIAPISPGEQRQLDTIRGLIDDGEALMAAGEFASAIERFHAATRKALALI